MNKAHLQILIGVGIMAIGASAKAIVDVAVLKSEKESIKEMIVDLKSDIKYDLEEIKNDVRDLKKSM